MTLPEILERLERQANHAERVGATAPVHSVLYAVIEDLQQLNGNGTQSKEPGDIEVVDKMLRVPDVAERLGVEPRYVYDHSAEWPFLRRLGRSLRFSERGLERWLERRRQ